MFTFSGLKCIQETGNNSSKFGNKLKADRKSHMSSHFIPEVFLRHFYLAISYKLILKISDDSANFIIFLEATADFGKCENPNEEIYQKCH
jgi:hypothetical protein